MRLKHITFTGIDAKTDIQEFTSERPECNDMTVEDFVYYLFDFSRGIK